MTRSATFELRKRESEWRCEWRVSQRQGAASNWGQAARTHAAKFFRLVQRPGLKRSHSDNREVSLGGQARVYS